MTDEAEVLWLIAVQPLEWPLGVHIPHHHSNRYRLSWFGHCVFNVLSKGKRERILWRGQNRGLIEVRRGQCERVWGASIEEHNTIERQMESNFSMFCKSIYQFLCGSSLMRQNRKPSRRTFAIVVRIIACRPNQCCRCCWWRRPNNQPGPPSHRSKCRTIRILLVFFSVTQKITA